MVEIVALTFGVKSEELNAALCEISFSERTSSILSDEERENLYRLSMLVRSCNGCISRDKTGLTDPEDEDIMLSNIIVPI